MIKYLKQKRWKESQNNDLDHNQFHLQSVTYDRSDTSIIGSIKMDRIENYILFLKTIDAEAFGRTISSVINSAKVGGVDVFDESISVDREENGYLINLSFTIRS